MAPGRPGPDRTRADLLDAAVACLAEVGSGQLATRAIAERAGVPVSQIHYHFGGKDGLLLAVLEHQDERLLARQRSMYAADLPLSTRWERACDYLEEDLASGYVRVLQELIALGWSDPTVAARVADQLGAWADLLATVADDAAAQLGFDGIAPRHVAVLVGCAFLGAEQLVLLGAGDRIEAIDALRALGELIGRFEGLEEGP